MEHCEPGILSKHSAGKLALGSPALVHRAPTPGFRRDGKKTATSSVTVWIPAHCDAR